MVPSTTDQLSNVPQTLMVPVGGIAFTTVSMRETVVLILLLIQKASAPQHICTGDLYHLYLLEKDRNFREIYRQAALMLAYGMPIVWLSRLNCKTRSSQETPVAESRGLPGALTSETRLRERVAGSDLFWELARASDSRGIRLFFRFETEEEQDHIEQIIREAAPDVLFVGLGAPKQEKWILAHKARFGVPVSIGVGGILIWRQGSYAVRRAGFRRAAWSGRTVCFRTRQVMAPISVP